MIKKSHPKEKELESFISLLINVNNPKKLMSKGNN